MEAALRGFEKKRRFLGPQMSILSLEWVSDFDVAR